MFRCRRRCSSRKKQIRTGLFSILALFIFIFHMMNDGKHRGENNGTGQYKTIFSQSMKNNASRKTILLWSTYCGGKTWYNEQKPVFPDSYDKDCVLTTDRSKIAEADVVLFYIVDIAVLGRTLFGFDNSFPKYRHPDQIWVLYTLEPLTKMYVSWSDFKSWNGVFNWTMSYDRRSEVFTPFGRFKQLSKLEMAKVADDGKVKNYFRERPLEEGVAMISHCSDDAERYKTIRKLQNNFKIRVFGRCGESCPDGHESCEKLIDSYKFYFAFENSDCVDYVSEKYWRAIYKGLLPVVAWRLPMNGVVIPGSYINVFDFPDLDSAGKYLAEVSKNESLYDSYFDWKFKYSVLPTNGWCALCDKIHSDDLPRMTYSDIAGWFYNNSPTCRPLTWTEFIRRKWDRFTHDFRI